MNAKADKNSIIKTGRIVGLLFLIAMAASLLGGIWLESITSVTDYLASLFENQTQVVLGVLLEVINCLAVVGIAVAVFPLFRRQNEALALGYVCLRVIEATILLFAALSPLLLISISQEYIRADAASAANFQNLGALVRAARAQLAGLLTAIFFGLGALLFYYLLYRTRLVPRFISVWGFIGAGLILIWNLLETFGIHISAGMILALPMILNEIFLGIWLIVRGFNSFADVSVAVS